VIDEARALLWTSEVDGSQHVNGFRLLRRAITKLWDSMRKLGCLFLLLDTTSTVTNFVPSANVDPSYRGGSLRPDAEKRRLLPPFFNLPVLDEVDGADCIPVFNAELDMRVFLRGRPLWQSYFARLLAAPVESTENMSQHAATLFKTVVGVAKVKLLGGASDVSAFDDLHVPARYHPLRVSAACLAVCGNLVQCIEPFPTSAVSSQMLSSHMVSA
jgi:hypothetical protein